MRRGYQLAARVEAMPSSRRRSLLRDFADGLLQQMFLWGCDARRKDGNLLVEFGMQRIARSADAVKSEGTSRYRMPWEGGVVELHGFCAGWYPQRAKAWGVLFVRHRGRVELCDGTEAVTPGEYKSIGDGNTDTLLESVMPLVRWLVSYESWIQMTMPSGYRHACWMEYLSLMGARPWLPPDEALRWLRCFANSPHTTSRARAMRPAKAASSNRRNSSRL